jgi:hypothetical protein
MDGHAHDMPRIGLEPTRLAASEPKSDVSTNFTTWAESLRVYPENTFYSRG